MKRTIQLRDYAGHIFEKVSSGVLLTTKAQGKVNTMTIGWGTLGTEWKQPVFVAYVRKSRYTKQMLDENPEFTVNIPMDDKAREILALCGSKSGRDTDKISQLGLTLEPGETVSVPGIRELPLTLECKVIYKQEQLPAELAPEYQNQYYKEGSANEGDFHTAYYGRITAAYILE